MCCNWGTDTPQVFATAQTESTVGAPAGGGYAFFGIYVDNLSTLAGLGNYAYASVPAPTTVGGPVQIAEGAHTYVPVGSATSGSGIMYAFNTDVFVQVMG